MLLRPLLEVLIPSVVCDGPKAVSQTNCIQLLSFNMLCSTRTLLKAWVVGLRLRADIDKPCQAKLSGAMRCLTATDDGLFEGLSSSTPCFTAAPQPSSARDTRFWISSYFRLLTFQAALKDDMCNYRQRLLSCIWVGPHFGCGAT